MLSYILTLLFVFLPNQLYALKRKYDYNTIASQLLYPVIKRTPGDILPDVTEEDVCSPGYARLHRKVSGKTKREVKQNYKIPTHFYDDFIIDHFIPLSLGGSNDIRNLWPQPKHVAAYVADDKTKSDTFLFNEVCSGRMELETAQQMIIDDWIAVYESCCTGKAYSSTSLASIMSFPYQANKAASIKPS